MNKNFLKLLLSSTLIVPLGFRRARHFGRWLNVEAHGDALGEDWATNGEGFFFRAICQMGSLNATILEVGANDGTHTLAMLETAAARSNPVTIHSFEPSSFNQASWLSRVQNSKYSSNAHLIRLACSNSAGSAVLRTFDSQGGGENSLVSGEQLGEQNGSMENVLTVRLEAYCAENKLSRIFFLKIDTEGHDVDVLEGIYPLIQQQTVDFIQFEYNNTWIKSRKFLKDAFALLQPCGYQIGKLHRNFIEEFPRWDYRLEWFEHSNYVAWLPTHRHVLPLKTTDSFLA